MEGLTRVVRAEDGRVRSGPAIAVLAASAVLLAGCGGAGDNNRQVDLVVD